MKKVLISINILFLSFILNSQPYPEVIWSYPMEKIGSIITFNEFNNLFIVPYFSNPIYYRCLDIKTGNLIWSDFIYGKTKFIEEKNTLLSIEESFLRFYNVINGNSKTFSKSNTKNYKNLDVGYFQEKDNYIVSYKIKKESGFIILNSETKEAIFNIKTENVIHEILAFVYNKETQTLLIEGTKLFGDLVLIWINLKDGTLLRELQLEGKGIKMVWDKGAMQNIRIDSFILLELKGLIKIDLKNPTVKWTKDYLTGWSLFSDLENTINFFNKYFHGKWNSTPIYKNDVVYTAPSGIIRKIDFNTGFTLWESEAYLYTPRMFIKGDTIFAITLSRQLKPGIVAYKENGSKIYHFQANEKLTEILFEYPISTIFNTKNTMYKVDLRTGTSKKLFLSKNKKQKILHFEKLNKNEYLIFLSRLEKKEKKLYRFLIPLSSIKLENEKKQYTHSMKRISEDNEVKWVTELPKKSNLTIENYFSSELIFDNGIPKYTFLNKFGEKIILINNLNGEVVWSIPNETEKVLIKGKTHTVLKNPFILFPKRNFMIQYNHEKKELQLLKLVSHLPVLGLD